MPNDEVPNKKDKPWYINMLYYPVLITFLTTIVGTFFTELNMPHDFTVSINPVSASTEVRTYLNQTGKLTKLVIQPPENISYATIAVRNVRLLNKYDHPVYLHVGNASDHDYVNGIEVYFDPHEMVLPFDSTATVIIGSNLSAGEYPITIYGLGGDEKQRRCTLMVSIKSRTIKTGTSVDGVRNRTIQNTTAV